jgi:predicted ATPase/DNA-binding winged helix-turn-helix (wHTH) protein
MTPGRSFQFGAFRLDADGGVLYRGGERIALTPKAIDVLVALVRARERPVGREELLQQVWAGTVVEEGSLTSHISQLRKTLGEGYIETLPKRGYRFVGRVDDPVPPSSPPVLLPAAAPARTRTNLPPPLTAFIGRREALAQVGDQVHQCRIVTLVGAGGTGKTRLSQEAARGLLGDFPDGVWLVEYAPLTDVALVARTIVTVLGARAEGDTPPMALIESSLRDQRVLLLLDNCEHVVDEAAAVAQSLLRALPRLHILATSRQPLGVEGEVVYRVPSLSIPGSAEQVAPPDVIASEAGQLFVERARAVQPAFALTDRNAAAVARVCQRLDGIPLAIELAAARLTALSVDEVARRIEDRFHLLTGGLRTALPRHRTLRALVDWSYELLAPDERRVLDVLSVFSGGFSLAAAESVAGDAAGEIDVLDAVEHLVAKSLLIAQSQDGAETRYRLLETIRQYASEKLTASGLAPAVVERHFDYFLDLAETAEEALKGPQALEWLARLDAEHDNLRSALDGAANSNAIGYARLAGSLRFFWDVRGHFTEGWTRLEHACAVHAARDLVRAHALIGAGLLAFRLAYAERNEHHLNQAIALTQEMAFLHAETEATLALGHTRRQQGADAADPVLERARALARRAGDRRFEGLALMELGRCAMSRGRYTLAQGLLAESAALLVEGQCVIDAPSAAMYAGECAFHLLDFVTARRLLEEVLRQHREVGFVHEAADTVRMLGELALQEGRLDEALTLTAESLRTYHSLHDPKCSGLTTIHYADALRAAGKGEDALAQAQDAVAIYRKLGLPFRLSTALCAVGCVHAMLGQSDVARRTLFSGLVEQQRDDRNTHLPQLLEAIAAVHAESAIAVRLLGAAATLREDLESPLLPTERADRDARYAQVRQHHADADFERELEVGRSLTRNDAIGAALTLRVNS